MLLPIAATGQRVTIKGRITDHNNKPIEIANVSVIGEPVGTIADFNGNYSLTCNSKDSLTIAYSMIGYQTRKRTFRNPTDTLIVNVMLPAPIKANFIMIGLLLNLLTVISYHSSFGK